MKDFKNGFIYPLIVGIIIAVGSYIFLTREEPDIRFTLSEAVPNNISNLSQYENLQQLEIKNVGNAKAEKIKVNIAGNIKSYDVIKYSQADKEKRFTIHDGVEFLYPDLPPEGSFRIIVKTDGQGVQKDNVKVNHSKGTGTDALSSEKGSIANGVANIIVFCIYIIITFLGFRDLKISSYERNAKHLSESFLQKKRPFYISKEKWTSIRKDAVSSLLESGYHYSFKNIDEEKEYKILKNNKPEYLSEEEWNKLVEDANKQITDKMSRKVSGISCYNLYKLDELFLLEKPKNLKTDIWNKFCCEVNDRYIILKKESFLERCNFINPNLEYIIAELSMNKPDGIEENKWKKYNEMLKDIYTMSIKNKILVSDTPYSIFNDSNKEFIKERDVSYLKKTAVVMEKYKLYQKFFIDITQFIDMQRPIWMDEKEYKELNQFIIKVSRVDELRSSFEAKVKAIQDTISLIKLSQTRPNTISEENWNEIKSLNDELLRIVSINKEKNEFLYKESKRIDMLIKKVTWQLEIIDKIFKEPDIIDKIEGYNNMFSEGNLKNLKLLSNKLKDI